MWPSLAVGILSIAALVPTVSSAQSLRLSCAGSEAVFRDGRWSTQQFQLGLWIDTAAKTYCMEPCRGPEPMKSAGERKYVLRDFVESGLHSNRMALTRTADGFEFDQFEDAQNVARRGFCQVQPAQH